MPCVRWSAWVVVVGCLGCPTVGQEDAGEGGTSSGGASDGGEVTDAGAARPDGAGGGSDLPDAAVRRAAAAWAHMCVCLFLCV